MGICINDCSGESPATKIFRANHIVGSLGGIDGKGLNDGAPLYTSNSNVGLLVENNYIRDDRGHVSGLHAQSRHAFYSDEGAMGTLIHGNVIDGGQLLHYTNNTGKHSVGDNLVNTATPAQRRAIIAATGPREPFRSLLGLTILPVAFASSSWVVNASDKHVPSMAFDGNLNSYWRSTPLGTKDLAFGRSLRSSSGAGPEAAADQNPETWWRPGTLQPGEWVEVDLGAINTVRQVSLHWRETPTPRRLGASGLQKAWTIRTSIDGANWHDCVVKARDDEAVHHCAFNATSARFVRVCVDQSAEVFDLAELQVFGLPLSFEESLTYDFGHARSVSGLTLFWGLRHARRYSILHSDDGEQWILLAKVNDGQGGEEAPVLPRFHARYVRLAFHESSASTTEGAYELRELRFQHPPQTLDGEQAGNGKAPR